jgi:stage V sporulation protein G
MNITAKIVKTFSSATAKGKVLAIADAVIENAFVIHGIKIIDGEKGVFMSMPNEQYKNKEGKLMYSDVFHPISSEARESLHKAVFEAYANNLDKTINDDYSFAMPEMY